MLALSQERIEQAFNAYEKNVWFNCWGATLYVLGAAQRLYWEFDFSMDSWLGENTAPIHRPRKAGDILEVRSKYGGNLLHTAVYIGNGKYFHKLGGFYPEITDFTNIRQRYGGDVYWRRLLERAA